MVYPGGINWKMGRIHRRVSDEVIEGVVLFTSVIKWFIIAAFVGIVVGFSTSGFLKVLEWSISLGSEYRFSFLLLPFSLFLSSLIVKYLAEDAEGHGTEKVIEAIHKRAGKISLPVVPVKFIATVITIATGGSAGKEGPAAQIGGGLASFLADIFRFDDSDRRKLVICGISAGFSTVFGTPIAGAIFGIEVLFIGNLFYDALFPSFVAGMIGYHVASSLGITYFYNPIEFAPVFSGSFIIEVVFAGTFLGFCSFIFIELLEYLDRLSHKIKVWAPLKGLIGGSLLVVLALLFSTRFLGLGLDSITDNLSGVGGHWYDFLLKMIFTAVTLNFGGSGGIVTPIFFIGSSSGSFLADVMGLDRATFAAIGLVGLLSGAANTPIAASIMAVELFGAEIAPYAALVCIISYLITGHRSVYPSQILMRSKSSSVIIEPGRVIENIGELEIKTRSKTLFGTIIKLVAWIRDLVNRLYESLMKLYRKKYRD